MLALGLRLSKITKGEQQNAVFLMVLIGFTLAVEVVNGDHQH
jgi:hypothetical protein